MRHRAALLATVLGGLLLRVLYLNQAAALPFFDRPVGDSEVYLRRAAEILSGAWIPARPFFYGSVLYPYGLAAILALPFGSLYLVALLQMLAGAGVVYLVARLGRRLFGKPAGLAAALLGALYGPFAFLEADLIGVAWGLLAVAAGSLWLLHGARKGSPALLAAAGLAFGLAAAERPNLLVLLPVAFGWLVLLPPGAHASPGRRTFRLPGAGALLAGAAGPLLLVAGLNSAAAGRFLPLNTSGGINLAIGYHPGAKGTFDEPWAAADPEFTARWTDLEEASLRMAEIETGRRPLRPEEASAHWRGKALAFLRENPLEALAVTARKAALLLNGAEVPNHLNFRFLRTQAPALSLMPIGFAALLPLAVLGGLLGWGRGAGRDGIVLLALVSAAAAASVLPFFVADRYRAPMVPPLLVLAGGGLTGLIRLVRRPEARRAPLVGPALIAAIAAAGVALVPLSRPDPSRDWWMLAQAWKSAGDLPRARAAYEAAVAEAPGDGVLWNNLGTVYRGLGLLAEAEGSFRRAVAVAPGLALPHRNLGMLLSATGRAGEGLEELRAAVRLGGGDAEVLGAVAALLAERGERGEAAAAWTEARRLDPGDPRLARLVEDYPWLATGVEPTSPRARP